MRSQTGGKDSARQTRQALGRPYRHWAGRDASGRQTRQTGRTASPLPFCVDSEIAYKAKITDFAAAAALLKVQIFKPSTLIELYKASYLQPNTMLPTWYQRLQSHQDAAISAAEQ
eukprot:scaffold65888_cov14-Tisochrysis_lutea.AAC.1